MGILKWLFGGRSSCDPALAPQPQPAAVPPTPKSTPVRFRPPQPPDPRYPLDIGPVPLQLATYIGTARAAREAGDIPAARAHYQRAAYGFSQLSEAQIEALKQEIASLARADPLYLETLPLLREQLLAAPGLLQADLTRQMGGPTTEALRYVLYYADQIGDIVRVKSGRSYRLYLPGQPVPPEPEKPL